MGFAFFLAKKPAEVKPVAAETVPGELAVDLNEKQLQAIKIGVVGTRTFVIERQAVGTIDFNQNRLTQVFTPYQGRIIAALPNVGDRVEKDQVLFTIDSPDLLNAESALIAAAGVLKLQNATLARAQKMKSFGGASQQAVDQSASDQQTAEGNLKSARDAVRIFGKTDEEIDNIIALRKADPRLVVKSPMTGYVTTRNAAPGLFVQPGVAPPPFTVADLSTMWLFANVPETETPLFKVGQRLKAHVAAYPGRDFDGTITVLGPSVDPNTRRIFVRSEIEDPQHLLRGGMFADFTIRLDDAVNATAVPAAAVVREGDGSMSAWTTKDDRHFVRRTVKVGHIQEGYDQILEGLKRGERVVVEGAVFLSNKLAGGSTD
ncbi:efflux transporter periplasmic adaptor subunit [Methylocystis bryophila]|uniref:Efflux transporter periplasmic adaptor subunit n=1 Tax=Methylocystis bryophila TaxID=655015 RepID=A0A1W6N1G8_9HYPH|nr:efflux transporter periplasmic adaptor subunit [Methylocystis bryophila]